MNSHEKTNESKSAAVIDQANPMMFSSSAEFAYLNIGNSNSKTYKNNDSKSFAGLMEQNSISHAGDDIANDL